MLLIPAALSLMESSCSSSLLLMASFFLGFVSTWLACSVTEGKNGEDGAERGRRGTSRRKRSERAQVLGRSVLEKCSSVLTCCSRSVFLYVYGVLAGKRHGDFFYFQLFGKFFVLFYLYLYSHLATGQSARVYCCLATWLLVTGVPAWCDVLRVRCPGPRGSWSAMCSLGALRSVCGLMADLAPVHRCAHSACCVACAVSWATWLLFTAVHTWRVVLCVRCPMPLGSCSPLCTLGVWCCVCGVPGHLAPVHRCARSVCGVACAASSASWLAFCGLLARCVALCVACAVSWATWLLITGTCAGCAVLRVRKSLQDAHSSVRTAACCSRQGLGTLRALTRPSGRRLFCSRQGLGTLPEAHSSIRAAAVLWPAGAGFAAGRARVHPDGGWCCLARVLHNPQAAWEALHYALYWAQGAPEGPLPPERTPAWTHHATCYTAHVRCHRAGTGHRLLTWPTDPPDALQEAEDVLGLMTKQVFQLKDTVPASKPDVPAARENPVSAPGHAPVQQPQGAPPQRGQSNARRRQGAKKRKATAQAKPAPKPRAKSKSWTEKEAAALYLEYAIGTRLQLPLE